jgi:tripartite-type tricarboxylate transporter receptor subunit TctC
VNALDTPQVRQRLLDEGAAPESSTPEELGAFIRAEIDKWEKVVKRSGVRLD